MTDTVSAVEKLGAMPFPVMVSMRGRVEVMVVVTNKPTPGTAVGAGMIGGRDDGIEMA